MSEDQNVQKISLYELKANVGSKLDMYNKLSTKYVLPDLTSRAVSKDYLKSYTLKPCPVFRILREHFKLPYIATKHFDRYTLFEAIEQILHSRKLPPTGFNFETVPNLDWLIGVYAYLSPGDEKNIFKKTTKYEAEVEVKIDPEIYAMLKNDVPKIGKRSVFQLTEQQKEAQEEQILERRIQIHSKRLKILAAQAKVAEMEATKSEQELKNLKDKKIISAPPIIRDTQQSKLLKEISEAAASRELQQNKNNHETKMIIEKPN